jgi:hypothetical protein
MQARTQMGTEQNEYNTWDDGQRERPADPSNRATPPAAAPGTQGHTQASEGVPQGMTHTQQMRAVMTPGIVRRRGLVGWWLNLTAPAWPKRTLPIGERERLRKAELTSFSILAVFLLLVSLVSNSLAHPATAQAVLVMGAGLVVAGVLNRRGNTRTAAYLVPTLLMLVIAAAIVRSAGGLQLALLPAYDLFALPVFLISLIGDRRATWVFAGAAVVFILVDFSVQPHAHITAPGAQGFDDIRYAIGQVTWWGEVNRHVALVLFAALFGWLGARSVDLAIRRADRAEEVAALEHAVADQKRRLDHGVRQILETHVRVANGDFSARAPTNQQNVLWQIAASLNNLLTRLQKAGHAEYRLLLTEAELRRLALALDEARMGKQPIWPAPTGTAADIILARVAQRGSPAEQPADGTPGSRPVITVQAQRGEPSAGSYPASSSRFPNTPSRYANTPSRVASTPSMVGGSRLPFVVTPSTDGSRDGGDPRSGETRNPPPWMRQSRRGPSGDLTADAETREHATTAPNPPWM